MSAETLFISDLHLDPERPDISAHFLNFIKTRASDARVLYILGDLFEVWAGDDSPADEFREIFTALQTLSRNTEIFFMHGNRDFLVGQQLARKAGFSIIQSPTIITLESQRIVLLHGDELCTDDKAYQTFREKVRQPHWQHDFLAKSLTERLAITAQLRAQSHAAMTQKTEAIMDVNQQAVDKIFKQYKVDTLIHGHTHRPAIHTMDQFLRRFVLGDWNPDPSYISWSKGQLKLFDARV